jgi:hypothetical protein
MEIRRLVMLHMIIGLQLSHSLREIGGVAGIELIAAPESPLAARNHSPSAASKNS